MLTQLFLEVFEDIVDGSGLTPEDLYLLAEATVNCHNTQIAHNTCAGEKKVKKSGVGGDAAVIEANRESSESSDATSCRSWCQDKSAQQMQEDHGISQPPKNNKNPAPPRASSCAAGVGKLITSTNITAAHPENPK